MENKRDLAEPAGYCWCGCGEKTNKFFAIGHDRKAQDYLVKYFLEFLQRKHTDNPTENLLHALGFDPEVNRLKTAMSRTKA